MAPHPGPGAGGINRAGGIDSRTASLDVDDTRGPEVAAVAALGSTCHGAVPRCVLALFEWVGLAEMDLGISP